MLEKLLKKLTNLLADNGSDTNVPVTCYAEGCMKPGTTQHFADYKKRGDREYIIYRQ